MEASGDAPLLGLDAGGTGTRWVLLSPAGELLRTGHAAPLSGLMLLDAEGRLTARQALQSLLADTGAVRGLGAGLTGFDPAQQDEWRALVHEAAAAQGQPAPATWAWPDVELLCHAAAWSAPSLATAIVVYGGTGSVAAQRASDGTLHRAGGRGAVVDDAGGGHWIAREALRAVWRAEDAAPGSGVDTPLGQALGRALGGSSWTHTRRAVATASRGSLGRLALPVAEAAHGGDPLALGLLQAAGRELARLALALLRRCGPQPVVLAGRVFDLHPVIEATLRDALAGLPAPPAVSRLATPPPVAAAGGVMAACAARDGVRPQPPGPPGRQGAVQLAPGLETPRLRLRALHEADLADFQAYRHDAEVGRWQGWRPTDDDTARAFLREMAALPFCPPGLWCQIAIAARADDRLLGDIGLHLAADGGHAEIGFSLARHAQGQGLAQEAVAAAVALVFAHTPAQAVHAITDSRNAASLRLLQRLGFRAAGGWPAVFRGQPCTEQLHVLPRPGLPPLQLRPADPHSAADADATADVLLASRGQLMPYVPAVHADDDVRRWVRQTLLPGGGVTLAVQAGAVQGVLAVRRGDGLSWIDQLYVHPRALARGVGRALLQHALAALPRPWRLYCFAANAHARGFYERHGFVALAHGDGSGNEEGCPDVLYGLD